MKKLIGNKAFIFFDTYDPARTLHGNGVITTAPKTWYYVVGRGQPSGIPAGFNAGNIFRSPVQGSLQLVLRTGGTGYRTGTAMLTLAR